MGTSRRQFLLSLGAGACLGAGSGALFRLARGEAPAVRWIRPPGARPETEFLSSCVRCGQCIEACPIGTLHLTPIDASGAAGTPHVIPEVTPCNLCRGLDELKCITACPTRALEPVADTRDIRMGTAVILKEICLAFNQVICRSCWHACPYPNEAIYFDEMLRPVVNEEVCIGCGLCTLACPTERTSIPIRPRGCGEEGSPRSDEDGE
jgi:ferredoxin-type protein NapG